jgi:hypothetical protein
MTGIVTEETVEPFLSLADVARRWNTSVNDVWKAVKARRLQFFDLSGGCADLDRRGGGKQRYVRFRPEQVKAYEDFYIFAHAGPGHEDETPKVRENAAGNDGVSRLRGLTARPKLKVKK